MEGKPYRKLSSMNNLPGLATFRKDLRAKLTPAEAALWKHLKGKGFEGRKFRRQHSLGGYILDFYCPAERLAIELDGQPHCLVSAQEYDRERDLFMAHFHVRVLRFENRNVFENPEKVLRTISDHFGWFEKALAQGNCQD